MAEVAKAMKLLDQGSAEGSLLLQAHRPLPLSVEDLQRVAAVPPWDDSWRGKAGPSYRDCNGVSAAGRSEWPAALLPAASCLLIADDCIAWWIRCMMAWAVAQGPGNGSNMGSCAGRHGQRQQHA